MRKCQACWGWTSLLSTWCLKRAKVRHGETCSLIKSSTKFWDKPVTLRLLHLIVVYSRMTGLLGFIRCYVPQANWLVQNKCCCRGRNRTYRLRSKYVTYKGLKLKATERALALAAWVYPSCRAGCIQQELAPTAWGQLRVSVWLGDLCSPAAFLKPLLWCWGHFSSWSNCQVKGRVPCLLLKSFLF